MSVAAGEDQQRPRKLRQPLHRFARVARVVGWLTIVPLMVVAALLLALHAVAPARNLLTGERADQPSAAAANDPGFRPTQQQCAQVRSPRQQPVVGHEDPHGTLRVFAIQYTLDFTDVTDYATWRTTLRCLMEDLVEPYRTPGQPTLVVFPEDMGLPTIALGARGAGARLQTGSPLRAASADVPLGLAGALAQLNVSYAPQVAAYQARFGPVDPRKQVFLAATDTFARAVNISFSELATEYGVYVVVSNNQAPYRETHNPAAVALFADPEVQPTDTAFVATSDRVTNTTFVWGPEEVHPDAPAGNRNLLFQNEKVPLTPLEKDLVGLDEGPATGPAAAANAGGPWIADFKVGLATSYPAFAYGYPFGQRPAGFDPCADTRVSFAACQDTQGVTLQIQADANPGRWAAYVANGNWQPLEWMTSVWRAVADPTVRFRYNVTPMMNGNLLDLVFDGQSTITGRDFRGPPRAFVGSERTEGTDRPDLRRYAGGKPQFLVMTPWSGGSGDDRAALEAEAQALGPRGAREGEYVQTAVFADLVP